MTCNFRMISPYSKFKAGRGFLVDLPGIREGVVTRFFGGIRVIREKT